MYKTTTRFGGHPFCSLWVKFSGSIAQFVGKRAVENAAPRKSPKADFPTALGNPATAAGFPLFPPPRLRRVNFPIPLRQEMKRRRIAELQPADLVFCL